TWWSPDPRAVIEFDSLHVSRSLLKTIRQQKFTSSMDQAFDRVIEGCAEQSAKRKSTWITPEFIDAYKEMHHAGRGHSVEVWREGDLVGGIYGIGLGGYFPSESMFQRVHDAS